MRLPGGALLPLVADPLTDGLRHGSVAALGEVRHSRRAQHAARSLPGRMAARLLRKPALHAPPGLAARHPGLNFDDDLTDSPGFAWDGEIDRVAIPGNRIATELAFFHHPSRTLLFTDLIQHSFGLVHRLARDRRPARRDDRARATGPAQVPLRLFRSPRRPGRDAARPRLAGGAPRDRARTADRAGRPCSGGAPSLAGGLADRDRGRYLSPRCRPLPSSPFSRHRILSSSPRGRGSRASQMPPPLPGPSPLRG